MDRTRFYKWFMANNCQLKQEREYVVEFYNNKLDDRLKRNTVISYNFRLDVYHVRDILTGEDVYSGDFDELERLFKLSDINYISKDNLKKDEYHPLMYDLHTAYKYGWLQGGDYRIIKMLKCIGKMVEFERRKRLWERH